MTYLLKFDGGATPNPGKAAGAAVLFFNNKKLHEKAFFIQHATNNEAEYSGLITGLELCSELDIKKVKIVGDSLLVINQLTSKWKCAKDSLIPYRDKCLKLLKNFDYKIEHVLREFNKEPDQLSDLCIQLEEDIDQFYV